ncbi:protein N-terminal glutamine amidohydrolase isoform X3 [Ziziphus jujuba]|uniref:Protein N-terminal glutamine amidohydrolase n=1 Tax=Ziziphus jujuba TaxID=326968 RepID=A0A6P4APA9_ZIZJJ|nr:protein N-terminal glutamine amidohydrolase isoform X3 [Ziziphus jujuba]
MTTQNLELSSSSNLDVSQFQHTPYYCEENVFFLCKKLCESGTADAKGSDLFVVFISNEKKQIPLWHQKASNRADGVILWDYHVICIQKKNGGDSPHLVWDLDSSLPFPSPLDLYISETIRPSFQLFSEYQSRFFRIVHAPVFLQTFASDRRHMKDSVGNWIAEPPAYDPIVAEDGMVHNLNEYLDIHASDVAENAGVDLTSAVFSEKLGVVISHSQLEGFFSQI